MIKMILLSICLLTTSAFASGGHDRGNGGYTVLCSYPNRPAVLEALDLYEARRFGRQIITFTEPDPFAIARKVINRLSVFNPERTKKLLMLVDHFQKHAVYLNSTDLPDVKDFGVLKIPNTCAVMPTIWQLREGHDADPNTPNVKYYINNKIWSKLNPINKAALIVHEIITFDYAEKNSLNARISVGILFSYEGDLSAVLIPDNYEIFMATTAAKLPYLNDRDFFMKAFQLPLLTNQLLIMPSK